MASYIYMKILESRPERYDRGISWLSLGASERIKQRIAHDLVSQGMRVLEIGAGTATMAILAAAKGTSVFGFDISPGMLEVARRNVRETGFEDRIELKEMGVAEMDRLEDESFDLAVSTLVFSELSPDEQAYALRQAYRVLRPEGKIAIADETIPQNPLKYLIYLFIWIPLFLFTFALTQTSTRAVRGLEGRVAEAGFRIEKTERSYLDSFIYITARKAYRP
jgi:ubiquinone/menaquinone biosynthesis C-methylase UbiE